MGWAKTQGNSRVFVGKARLKALLGGLPKNGTAAGAGETALCECSLPLVPKIRWELGGRRQEGRWKERGVWSCCILLLNFFFSPPG